MNNPAADLLLGYFPLVVEEKRKKWNSRFVSDS